MDRLLRGMLGGVVGLVAMRAAIKAASKAVKPLERREHERPEPPRLSNGHNKRSMSLIGMHARQDESAAAALGRLAYTKLTGREPSLATKSKLSEAMHWGYGLAMAAAYSAVRAPRARGLDMTGGVLFGLGLWVLGDELVVPLLGLGEIPTAHPLSMHITTLAGHLGYGVATAATTRMLEMATS